MKISVIVPVCNEEKCLLKLIPYLKEESGVLKLHELIIVDSGSNDNTETVARQLGAVLVRSRHKGRAVQMNVGAAAASGDVLYFVHADTFPPKGYADWIADHIDQQSEAGCFTSIF